MPNPPTLHHALSRPLDENLDSHTGTTGDSMSELSDSSAGRSAIGSALGSTAQFGVRKPHSGVPITMRSRRREPLFGPSGSRVFDGQPVQALRSVEIVKTHGRVGIERDVIDGDDDGRNAMATLSAAALDAGEGGS